MARKNNRRVNPRKAVHDGFYEDDGQYQGQGNRRARRAAKSQQNNEESNQEQRTGGVNFSIAKSFEALTKRQSDFMKAYRDGSNIFAYGSAGTGKTYLAMYAALESLKKKEAKKIVIVRSAVPVRDQGFLPGTIEEKEAPLKVAYRTIVNDITGCGTAFDDLSKKKVIQFVSTSFLRSITLDDSIIILDEVQNFNWPEISTALTRVGLRSRVIVCGDGKQDDLHYRKNDTSGFSNLVRVVSKMGSSHFTQIQFNRDDIVRSGFTKSFIIACEDIGV